MNIQALNDSLLLYINGINTTTHKLINEVYEAQNLQPAPTGIFTNGSDSTFPQYLNIAKASGVSIDTTALSLPTSGDVAISFWINWKHTQSFSLAFTNKGSAPKPALTLTLDANGSWSIEKGLASQSNHYKTYFNHLQAENRWVHIVWSISTEQNRTQLYIDGQRMMIDRSAIVGSPYFSFPLTNTTFSLKIGGSSSNPLGLAALRMFAQTLETDEVALITHQDQHPLYIDKPLLFSAFPSDPEGALTLGSPPPLKNSPIFGSFATIAKKPYLIDFIGYHIPNLTSFTLSFWLHTNTSTLTQAVKVIDSPHLSISLTKTSITYIVEGQTYTNTLPPDFANAWNLITYTASISANTLTIQLYLNGTKTTNTYSQATSTTSFSNIFKGEIAIGSPTFTGHLSQLYLWQGVSEEILSDTWNRNFQTIASKEILTIDFDTPAPYDLTENHIPVMTTGTPTLKQDPIFGSLIQFDQTTALKIGLRRIEVGQYGFSMAFWAKLDTRHLQPYNNGNGTPQTLISDTSGQFSLQCYSDKIIWKSPRITTTMAINSFPTSWALWICAVGVEVGIIDKIKSKIIINTDTTTYHTSSTKTRDDYPQRHFLESVYPTETNTPLHNFIIGNKFHGAMSHFTLWQKDITYQFPTKTARITNYLTPLYISIEDSLVANIPLNAPQATTDISSNKIPITSSNLTFQNNYLFQDSFSFNKQNSHISLNLQRFRLAQPQLIISFWAKINFTSLQANATILTDSSNKVSIQYNATSKKLQWQIGSLTATTYTPQADNNLWRFWAFTAEISEGKISLQIWRNNKQVTNASPQNYTAPNFPKFQTLTLGTSSFLGSISQFQIHQLPLTTQNVNQVFPYFETLSNDLVAALPLIPETKASDESGNNILVRQGDDWENNKDYTYSTNPFIGGYVYDNGGTLRLTLQGANIRIKNKQALTISFWINISASSSIFLSNASKFAFIQFGNNKVTWKVAPNKQIQTTAPKSYEWHLLSLTANLSANELTLSIFLDSKQLQSATLPFTGKLPSLEADEWIITSPDKIANFTIWQKALSTTEIQTYYFQTVKQPLVLSLPLIEDAKDISGNQIPTVPYQDAKSIQDALMGKVLQLHKLNISYPKVLLSNTLALTISFWAKVPTSLTNSQTILSKGVAHSGGTTIVPNQISISFNPLKWNIGGKTLQTSVFNTAIKGSWHYFTFTAERKTNTSLSQNIYIDGNLVASQSTTLNTPIPPLHPCFIDANYQIPLTYFTVYQEVLTPQQILNNFESLPIQMATKPLLAYFKFDTNLKDQSGNQITTENQIPPHAIATSPKQPFEKALYLQSLNGSPFTIDFSSILIKKPTELTIDFWAYKKNANCATFLTTPDKSISIGLLDSGKVTWSVNGVTASKAITPSTLTNKWIHWAFVAKWANNVLHIQIFQNGVKQLATPISQTHKSFPILKQLVFFQTYYGYISNLRIWQETLIAHQLKELITLDKAHFPTELPSALPEPISFTLTDKDGEPSIYITDDLGSDLEINIFNESAYPLVINPITSPNINPLTFNPESDGYNFQLRFQPNVVKPKTISLNRRDTNWTCIEQENIDKTLSLYFIYTGTTPLSLSTAQHISQNSLHLHLQNVVALSSTTDQRTTKVELEYHNLLFQSSTQPLNGFLLSTLNIINHLGRKDIDLEIGFWGTNGILNNGTHNVLVIRLTNTGSTTMTIPTSARLRIGAHIGRFGLILPTYVNSLNPCIIKSNDGNAPSNLSTIQDNQNNYTSSQSTWQTATTNNSPIPGYHTWIQTPKSQQTLPPNESIYIILSDFISNAKDGSTTLRIEYEGILDNNNVPYWAGSQELTVIKSPLLIQDKEVTIQGNLTIKKSSLSQGDLTVQSNIKSLNGGLSVAQDISTSKGNIHDQYGQIPPVGTIVMWYGTYTEFAKIKGWLICDGSPKNAQHYPQLYKAITGLTYTSGYHTFTLPDFTNKFPYGATTNNIQNNNQPITGGNPTYKLQQSDLPNHEHAITIDSGGEHSHNINTEGSDIDLKTDQKGSCYETENTNYTEYSGLMQQEGGKHSHTATMGGYCRGEEENPVTQTSFSILPPYTKVLFLIKY